MSNEFRLNDQIIKVRFILERQSEKLLVANLSVAINFFVYETDQKLGPVDNRTL